jgi:DNA-binding transcriptional LysR family regulator
MSKIYYDVRDIRAVCELTRSGGFREAAETLSITSSALSRRVAKLEAAIGGLLVKRTTRSVAVTPLGRRLVARCEPLINNLDECVEESARIAKGMEGQISVGCVSSIAYALLPPAVAAFRQRHPNLRISMKDDDGFHITAAVLNYEIEFGLTTVVSRNQDLHAELVATDPFVLVCAPDHPLAKAKSLRWEQIVPHRLMGYKASSSIRQIIDGRLGREGIELLWFDEVGTLSSLLSYLKTGAFVGVVPKLISNYLSELVAVPVTGPKLQRKIYLVRRSDTELTAPALSFWKDVAKRVSSASNGEPVRDAARKKRIV